MGAQKRIQGVWDSALRLAVDDTSKLVMMSDLHRGTGNGADNFARNQNLFYTALNHYHREGFTYLELGDGDDLWENRSFPAIAAEYDHIFELMANLHREGRLYMLWGNHDAVKKHPRWVEENLHSYRDLYTGQVRELFPGLAVREGMVLEHRPSGMRLLLLHGQQADFFNDRLWRLGKFLVRYVWKTLELVGVQNPTNASINPKRRDKVERKLAQWCRDHGALLVAGHTHRPIFPLPGEPLYFNDGCGVHPRYVSALELEGGRLSLVRWEVETRADGTLFVNRSVVSGPAALADLYVDHGVRRRRGYGKAADVC